MDSSSSDIEDSYWPQFVWRGWIARIAVCFASRRFPVFCLSTFLLVAKHAGRSSCRVAVHEPLSMMSQ
eukprot:2902926-Lingulodinium_polyedra.AAC.1